jgi:protein associated with RNAse G/E
MKVGERIHVRARKTDGTVYRSWQATIESVTTGSIVTIAPADQPVFDLYSKEFQ